MFLKILKTRIEPADGCASGNGYLDRPGGVNIYKYLSVSKYLSLCDFQNYCTLVVPLKEVLKGNELPSFLTWLIIVVRVPGRQRRNRFVTF